MGEALSVRKLSKGAPDTLKTTAPALASILFPLLAPAPVLAQEDIPKIKHIVL